MVWNICSITKSHNGNKKKKNGEGNGHQDWREKKIDLFISITQRSVLKLSVIEIRRAVCGRKCVCGGGWVVGWLAGWLIGANAAPCESSLYLDDKEPNLTQWNGRMVMETAFNLHRRSLFVDSRWKSECSSFVRSSRFSPLALYFASLRIAMKRALSFIYHRFSIVYFIQITLRAPACLQNGKSLYDCPSPPIVTTRKPTTTLLL